MKLRASLAASAFCILIALESAPLCQAAQIEYIFTHLAGAPGGMGSTDGTPSTARFHYPRGIAIDSAGTLYIADAGNHTVRKITAAGAVSTFAGSPGNRGSLDGPGAAASFSDPTGIAVDADGTVYVADETSHVIRKISPAGEVTTIAGIAGPEGGYVDGPGSSAVFYYPRGLAIDPAGNLFVSETYAIRKITPEGVVSTFAGKVGEWGSDDGVGGAARFRYPDGLATDSLGNVYVADRGNDTVRKITPLGAVTTLAGKAGSPGTDDGVGSAARFYGLRDITVDSAFNAYVTGTQNTVRKITASGVVTTVAGQLGEWGYLDGAGSAARFGNAYGVVATTTGELYIADSDNHVIRRVSSAGAVTTHAGVASGPEGAENGMGAAARIASPRGLVVDSEGSIYVAESTAATIRKISSAGIVSTFAGTAWESGSVDGVGSAARLNMLGYLAIDASDNLYAQQFGTTVRKISPARVVTTLNPPFSGFAPVVDGDGNMFMATDNTVKKITTTGVVTVIAGSAGQPGTADGTGSTARFTTPLVMATDVTGGVYLQDAFALRRIDSLGVVTTIAGVVGESGHLDGKGSAARFGTFYGMTIDSKGIVFVTDSAGTIRRIDPDGVTRTIGGTVGLAGSGDGVGAFAQFNFPVGIAVTLDGTIYIADGENHAVRKGVPVAIQRVTPTITWVPPAGITEGAALSTSQLNAVANVPGSFSYSPAEGAMLGAGSHTLTATFNPADKTTYTTASTQVTITVGAAPVTKTSRLVNIATRGYCGVGDRVMIGGFVVSGGAAKKVLVRAVGSSLTSRGIGASEVLLDPMIEVHRAATVLTSNDDWMENSNSSEILVTSTRIGAAPLEPGDTKSSALLLSLQPGVYSFVARGKAGSSGIVLLEVYDADDAAGGSNFVNIASRAFATSGNGVTIGGFVIAGDAPKRVLLRAVGPTLTAHGINQTDALTDPVMELHHGTTVIYENDDWTANLNTAELSATVTRVGAMPLAASDTTSSALLVTLEPGVYSFIARGKSSASGVVLVEVYDAGE